MILDFKEIPEAHINNGKQDTFEMFARDFFEELGFDIIEGPDRGADGGRDLIIVEERKGDLGKTNIRWLVSCKHKAHSGNSVTDRDDFNIKDRMASNQAEGFIGFYSTLPSSGLQKIIKSSLGKRGKIFDRENIEKIIIEKNMKNLMKRYFPNSLKKYEAEIHKASNVLGKYIPLKCEKCGKDLLKKDAQGLNIIVFYGKYIHNLKYVEDIYWSCKGECDHNLRQYYEAKGLVEMGWEEIQYLIIPTRFITWMLDILNGMKTGEVDYSDEAFKKLRKLLVIISQLTFKDVSEEEKIRLINNLSF